VGITNPSLFSRSLKRWCYGNRFLARIGENWHTPPSYCALAFNNGYRRIATCMCALTPPMTPLLPDKNLMNFGPVTPEFCRRFAPGGLHAGLCQAFLVYNIGCERDSESVRGRVCWQLSDERRRRHAGDDRQHPAEGLGQQRRRDTREHRLSAGRRHARQTAGRLRATRRES